MLRRRADIGAEQPHAESRERPNMLSLEHEPRLGGIRWNAPPIELGSKTDFCAITERALVS